MKKIKVGSIILLTLGVVLFSRNYASADEFSNIGSLYDKAVSEKIIDSTLYPKANWINDEISIMRPSYEEYKKVNPSTSYEAWLKLNNYGVMCDTKVPILQKKI